MRKKYCGNKNEAHLKRTILFLCRAGILRVHEPLFVMRVRWWSSRHWPELHIWSLRRSDLFHVFFRPDHHKSIIFQQKRGKNNEMTVSEICQRKWWYTTVALHSPTIWLRTLKYERIWKILLTSKFYFFFLFFELYRVHKIFYFLINYFFYRSL